MNKKEYTTPRAEKLAFDYAKVVVASGKSDDHGDWGNGRGCGRIVTFHGNAHGCNPDKSGF